MGLRKSVSQLTAAEKADYVNGVKALKQQGKYNGYVQIHIRAFNDAAHWRPAFLPWHREYLHRFENDIQQALNKPEFRLPYWDWTEDRGKDPATVVIWQNDFMGGNGSPVTAGPFRPSEWTLSDGGSLMRGWGDPNTLPTAQDVNNVLSNHTYDTAPWDGSSRNSFRSSLEQLHGRTHGWVGGTMLRANSPDDPVFFLHHCNIDRLWALWQCQTQQLTTGYLPVTGGPNGHNLWDSMVPWDTLSDIVRPMDVVNYMPLGCMYQVADNEFNGTFRQIITPFATVPIYQYELDTDDKPMNVEGTNTYTGSAVSFKVRIPRQNLIDLARVAKLSVYLNGNECQTITNKHVLNDQWQPITISLPHGDFRVTLQSGGDGTSWPDNTEPFILKDLYVSSIRPRGQ